MYLDSFKWSESINSQEKSWDILSYSDKINKIKDDFWDLSDNFDLFENFLNSEKNEDTKNQIIDLFNTKDKQKLFDLTFF